MIYWQTSWKRKDSQSKGNMSSIQHLGSIQHFILTIDEHVGITLQKILYPLLMYAYAHSSHKFQLSHFYRQINNRKEWPGTSCCCALWVRCFTRDWTCMWTQPDSWSWSWLQELVSKQLWDSAEGKLGRVSLNYFNRNDTSECHRPSIVQFHSWVFPSEWPQNCIQMENEPIELSNMSLCLVLPHIITICDGKADCADVA